MCGVWRAWVHCSHFAVCGAGGTKMVPVLRCRLNRKAPRFFRTNIGFPKFLVCPCGELSFPYCFESGLFACFLLPIICFFPNQVQVDGTRSEPQCLGATWFKEGSATVNPLGFVVCVPNELLSMFTLDMHSYNMCSLVERQLLYAILPQPRAPACS